MNDELTLPILVGHDQQNQIGFVSLHGGFIEFTFSDVEKLTKEDCFDIFGGAGIQVLESVEIDEKYYIKKARIFEFSLPAKQAAANNAIKLGQKVSPDCYCRRRCDDGMVLTDKEEPYTATALKGVLQNVENATKPDA